MVAILSREMEEFPPFEHANEMSQSKGPWALSSSLSSPSLASCQASYHKPPGLG